MTNSFGSFLRLSHRTWKAPHGVRLARSLSHSRVESQAYPIGGFYESLLEYRHPRPHPAASEPKADQNDTLREPSQAKSQEENEKPEMAAPVGKERPTIVFASKLVGPGRQNEGQNRETMIAGVRIPPKPEEPDNCCMSGCVNCVWDLFREEMEAWSVAQALAQKRLATDRRGEKRPSKRLTKAEEVREEAGTLGMDDDGALTSLRPEGMQWNDHLYANLPVGIREFMKQEKRLKLKHAREQAT